jgi:hypothetical protein
LREGLKFGLIGHCGIATRAAESAFTLLPLDHCQRKISGDKLERLITEKTLLTLSVE